MRLHVPVEEELFDGGPPLGWQKTLRLVRLPFEWRIARRAVASVLLGWFALVILAAAELAFGNTASRSFFADIAVHARYLIAVPLLIIAEADAIPWFDRIAHHFVSSGLVGDKDRPRYDAAISSTRRLLDATAAEFTVFLLAYASVMLLMVNLTQGETPAWYWADHGLPLGLSLTGLWHAFVSLPLLLMLFFGWLWRLLLWWRFLALMARLDLRLIPMHPDGAGGLRFVSASIRGYRLLAVGISTVVAGAKANLMLRGGETEVGLKAAMAAVVAFVLVLALGPLLVFLMKLRETKLRGIFQYGALGQDVGMEFERKWLNPTVDRDPATLDTNDFSAMTDLNQVVGNVYLVNDVPFGWREVLNLVVAALLPFIPVTLMFVPIGDIMQALKKLLL